MAHIRKRFLKPCLQSALKWSPVIGLTGLRQVGKTTLVENLVLANGGEFETFDHLRSLERAKLAPYEFLSRQKLLCLDEAQKAPEIFPVIKDIVGTQRKPGRFLLTGSIRFTLKKDIYESLTGRILNYELLPFTLAETHHLQSNPFLFSLFEILVGRKNKDAHEILNALPPARLSKKAIERHLKLGGMPVPCFARNDQKRQEWFRAYFETLLGRDLSLFDPNLKSISYQQGIHFLQALAKIQGEELNLESLATQSMMRRDLAKKMIRALEAFCLIEFVVPMKRGVKTTQKMRVEWKDNGLWYHALGEPNLEGLTKSKALNLLISHEFRSQIQMNSQTVFKSFYKNRDGASLPWIFSSAGKSVALIFLPHENPKIYDYRCLKQFVAESSATLGIVLGPEKVRPGVLTKNLWHLPYTSVF